MAIASCEHLFHFISFDMMATVIASHSTPLQLLWWLLTLRAGHTEIRGSIVFDSCAPFLRQQSVSLDLSSITLFISSCDPAVPSFPQRRRDLFSIFPTLFSVENMFFSSRCPVLSSFQSFSSFAFAFHVYSTSKNKCKKYRITPNLNT